MSLPDWSKKVRGKHKLNIINCCENHMIFQFSYHLFSYSSYFTAQYPDLKYSCLRIHLILQLTWNGIKEWAASMFIRKRGMNVWELGRSCSGDERFLPFLPCFQIFYNFLSPGFPAWGNFRILNADHKAQNERSYESISLDKVCNKDLHRNGKAGNKMRKWLSVRGNVEHIVSEERGKCQKRICYSSVFMSQN